MKKPEEAMEILEAYDATGSLRGAAALAGCDHKTVARLVAAREAAGGGLGERARQRSMSRRVALLLLFEKFIEHPLNPVGGRFLRPRFVDDLQHRSLRCVQT